MKYYINSNSEKLKNKCFYEKNVTSVDLQNVNYENNDMSHGFQRCTRLTSVSNISNSVQNMVEAFQDCSNLVSMPSIPSSVNDMGGAFAECYNLTSVKDIPEGVTSIAWCFANCRNITSAPSIPNSVNSVTGAFAYCYNLATAPTIPNSVNDLNSTFMQCRTLRDAPSIPNGVNDVTSAFAYCYNLATAPIIPNSVTNMRSTFTDCQSLVDAPSIPNSVEILNWAFQGCLKLKSMPNISHNATSLLGTFEGCELLYNTTDISNHTSIISMERTFTNCCNLVTAPIIPENVDNLHWTFLNCTKLQGDVIIKSTHVTNAYACFWGTSLTKNVYIPFKYENGVNTTTYNTFVSHGYGPNSVQHGVYLKDYNKMNEYYTLTINPTPADATVTLTADGYTQEGNSITVKYGTMVSYVVSKEGYTTRKATLTITSDLTESIVLNTKVNTEGSFVLGNYTVTSGLINENGIYSGFDETQSITVPSTYNVLNNEIITKFMMTEVQSKTGYLFDMSSLDVYTLGQDILFYTKRGAQTLITPELNKWYWLKLKMISNASIQFSYSEDGDEWNEIGTYDSYVDKIKKDIIFGGVSSSGGFPGIIDMNAFRVYNSEGQSIWGYPTTLKNNYIADSSLTNENEIYSNFSDNKGITIPSYSFAQDGNSIVTKFMLTESVDTTTYLYPGGSFDLYFRGNDLKYWTIDGTGVILSAELNKWYWLKIDLSAQTDEENGYKLCDFYISEDGTTWTLSSAPSHQLPGYNKPILLGSSSSSGGYLRGKIDMNEFKVYDAEGNLMIGNESLSPIGPAE